MASTTVIILLLKYIISIAVNGIICITDMETSTSDYFKCFPSTYEYIGTLFKMFKSLYLFKTIEPEGNRDSLDYTSSDL